MILMLNLAASSANKDLRDYLTPVRGAKKGPAYNSAILPFIKAYWDVENAALNSESLTRTIDRLKKF